jgi:site-specific DNA recombinase
MNATTVLIRRVKQGVAEWYRLQIKEKPWKGLREHTLAGWNIGPVPYGYAAEKHTHPVAYRAAQGATKTRLVADPERSLMVSRIFEWRVIDKLGLRTIAGRLNADPAAYPPPEGGWNVVGVAGILRNPKYTGHMVYGRRHKQGGRRRWAPPQDWLWSPEPTHPALITRAMWDAAQDIGAEHSTSRDTLEMSEHPQARRTYVLRSRLRCRICQRRMCGIIRYSRGADSGNTYYLCPHDPANPRHVAAAPGHPRTISVREDAL